MVVPATTSSVLITGTGTTAVLPFSWSIAQPSDLIVMTQVVATGALATLALNTNYTVQGTGIATGGTVTLLAGNLATGVNAFIASDPAELQLLLLSQANNANQADIMAALDLLTREVQATRRIANNALQFPLTESLNGVSSTLPPVSLRKGLIAGFDPTTGAVTAVGVTAGTAPVSAAMLPVVGAATLALARAALGPYGDTLVTASGSVTARTQANRASDTINVLDYGAVGDGATNDSAAIALALAALPSGGTLRFPRNHSYAIGSTVTVAASNAVLLFDDWTSGLKPIAAMAALITVTGDNVKILRGALINNASNATAAITRSGTSAYGMTVQGCLIASFTNGIVWAGSGNAGLMAAFNYFNAQTNAHILYNEDGRNSQITNNYMQGGKYGLYATFTTQQLEGLLFIGNTVQPTVAAGGCIYCNGGLYWYVGGNVLDAGASGVNINFDAGTVTHQITYMTVESNHIGIQAAATGMQMVQNCSYMKIRGNTFDGGAGSVGLSLSATSFSRFTENDFVNLTGTMIACTNACTFNNFTGNQLRGGGTTATEDSLSQNVWTGNYGAVSTKSPKSFFLYNWTDDVLVAESDWVTYTPAVTPASGTITTLGTVTGQYRRLGKTIQISLNVSITTNGSGAGSLNVSLPAASKNGVTQILSGANTAPALGVVFGIVTASASLGIVTAAGAYPGSNGSTTNITATYEAN